jgi:hypothetical protein
VGNSCIVINEIPVDNFFDSGKGQGWGRKILGCL